MIPCKCIRESGCLFLPRGWTTKAAWVGARKSLHEIRVMHSRKLYYTKHGPLWKDLDENLYRLYNFTGPDSTIVGKSNRWYSQANWLYIKAEKVNYDELMLEDLFSP